MCYRRRWKIGLKSTIAAFFFFNVLIFVIQLHINNANTQPLEKHASFKQKIENTETFKACEDWTKTGFKQSPPYFLTGVLLVRIYETDKAKLTTRELRQWLQFMQYAGCEHVYVYDAYHFKDESQYDNIKYFINNGYVTYIDWSHLAKPYGIAKTQASAYNHALRVYGKNTTTWQMLTDMDEYVFSSKDVEPYYLQRYIKNFQAKNEFGSEISINNYLFLGKPSPKEDHPYLADRLYRITKKKANVLDKQITRVANVRHHGIHHSSLSLGLSIDVDPSELRLNHYWGARLQNWGEDTEEILEKTKLDESFMPIAARLKANTHCPPIPDYYTYPVENNDS